MRALPLLFAWVLFCLALLIAHAPDNPQEPEGEVTVTDEEWIRDDSPLDNLTAQDIILEQPSQP